MTTHRHHATNASERFLAALVEQLVEVRPDWQAVEIRAVLIGHRHQVYAGDLAIASMRAAQTPDFRTPKTIGWRGPHWQGLETQPVEIRRRELCGVCGKTEDRCETQRVGVDDDHRFEPTPGRVRLERGR